QEEIASVFSERAKQLNAPITFAEYEVRECFTTDLLGSYQSKNIKGIVAVLKALKTLQISASAIKKGLLDVVANTGLKGRWQVLQNQPKIICDTAHNKEGLSLTMGQLQTESYEELHIVFGVVADKDLSNILQILPKQAQYYFCSPDNLRGLPVTELHAKAIVCGLQGSTYNSVFEALESAKQKAGLSDVIYVGGSTFVVAEIL
ncbi:MAG: glutamate ligase domain-containing protein, partial [Tenacibaculum sp.]